MPPEPTPPEQWPIHTYWQESEKRISQHWYISFCLMMSAVQDYLTGFFLHEKDNLNWATTCYYYSLVHTGRLLAFFIVGDFPTRHDELRNLYKKAYMPPDWKAEPLSMTEQQAGAIREVRFNWLNGFLERRGVANQQICPSIFSAKVNEHLNLSNKVDLDYLRRFAGSLNRLGILRTDANYESLIIAHEKEHRLVTDGFTRLVSAAKTAASESISLTIRSYKAYVNTSPLLNNQRDGFKLISNQYVAGRLYIALVEKVGTSNEVKESLESLCKSLTFDILESLEHSEHAEQIEQLIKLEQFDSKQSLMRKFLEKVERFEQVVKENS